MGWIKLDTKTLTTASTSLTSNTFTNKKFIQMLVHCLGFSGASNMAFRPNNDSGSNYAQRKSRNGASDITHTSETYARLGEASSTDDVFTITEMINITAEEKLIITHVVERNAAGAGNAPTRAEYVSKWVNTTAQETSNTLISTTINTMNANTELTHLGTD